MILVKKIKLLPTSEQEALMWKSSEVLNFAYNCALEHRLSSYSKGHKVNIFAQMRELRPSKLIIPELKFPCSQALKSVLFVLDAGFNSYFTKHRKKDKAARLPRFRSRYKFFTHEFAIGKVVVSGGKIRFNLGNNFRKLRPWISLTELPPDNFRSVYISKNQEGWFASFYVEKSIASFVDNGKILAADMGIKQFMVSRSNEGKVFMSGSISKMTKFYDKKIDKIRSKRDRTCKNSNRYAKLSKAWRRLSNKKTEKVRDFLHKLSHRLTTKFVENTIVVGDLSPGKWKKSENKKLNRSVQNNWFVSRFYSMLTYKSLLYGKRFVKINEAYTSKTCSSCGVVHEMPLWRRIMKCGCGYEEDRDINSAINILKRFYAQQVPAQGMTLSGCS